MKHRLAGWIDKARRLESAIEDRVEGGPRPIDTARQPLEIVHAVVRRVGQEVQPAGRGQQVFPYTHVRVWLAAASARDRVRLSAACDGPPSLEQRLIERLSSAGCAITSLPVKLSFVAAPRLDWLEPEFHLEFTRATSPAAENASASRLELTVTHGTAERSSYAFTGATVLIGRGSEVRDSHGRLIRTNQVAFLEGGGDVNQSVSRQHARLAYARASDTFRIHDDGASRGTSVIRDGRGLSVPRGRGLRLRSGDVLMLGDARVRVKIHEA
jgi:predicted component of type VI protein secretion system